MISIGPATRVFLAAGPIDMRKGFDGLADLARHQLESDPLSGHIFVFCNRRRNRVKLLYWDGSGFWLCTKRLEKGAFSCPAASGNPKRIMISTQELTLLLGGIELERVRHKNWWRRAAA